MTLIDLAVVDEGIVMAASLLVQIAPVKARGHLRNIDLRVVLVHWHRRDGSHVVGLVATSDIAVRIVLALADARGIETGIGTTHHLILLL